MPIDFKENGGRTVAQLTQQFEVEKRLAAKLKAATKEERKSLYGSVYDELFRSVPHHPQLTRKANAERELKHGLVFGLASLLAKFAKKESTFLEIGAGDCALTLHVASQFKWAYALDVSEQITKNDATPENFQLILSDGCSVPVPPGSVDLAFSHQLVEHLHPDDANEQLRNVHKALASKGMYVCITPSSFSGPHDISKYFVDEPCGFHLKEYSTGELVTLFSSAGFSRFAVFFWSKGILLKMPAGPVLLLEKILSLFPRPLQRKLVEGYPLNRLLGNFIAWK